MPTALFNAWGVAAEKAALAERAVFTKTVQATRPNDLPTDAELAAAVLVRLKASELLQQYLAASRRQRFR